MANIIKGYVHYPNGDKRSCKVMLVGRGIGYQVSDLFFWKKKLKAFRIKHKHIGHENTWLSIFNPSFQRRYVYLDYNASESQDLITDIPTDLRKMQYHGTSIAVDCKDDFDAEKDTFLTHVAMGTYIEKDTVKPDLILSFGVASIVLVLYIFMRGILSTRGIFLP